MRQMIFVEDGDTIAVIAKTSGPTVTDPCDNYPYVSQAYRIVADRVAPTLQIVPLATEPVRLSQIETNGFIARQSERLLADVKNILDDFGKEIANSTTGELPPIPPCGGRAHGNTTSGS